MKCLLTMKLMEKMRQVCPLTIFKSHTFRPYSVSYAKFNVKNYLTKKQRKIQEK